MIKINRNEFFNILQQLNKPCTYFNIKDKYVDEVEKFNNMLDFINLNEYNLDYIQNRFFAIKNRFTDLNQIERIIICPFDTKILKIEPCENTVYNYEVKKRNSYLTKPINKNERNNFTENTNEKDCIKGMMNPGLLNAVVIYMLQHKMFDSKNLIIFSLKSNDTQWHSDDILEYLQNNIYQFDNHIKMIIDMRFCSNAKGKPQKDFTGRLNFRTEWNENAIPYISKITRLEDETFKEKMNYTIKVDHNIKKNNPVTDFALYQRIINYFNINLLFQPRLFIFYDKSPSNKFSTSFLEKEFLCEWDSIEKYINILQEIVNI